MNQGKNIQIFIPDGNPRGIKIAEITSRNVQSILGFPIFDEIKKPARKETLTCKGKSALAKGEYTEEGMIVFKESTANVEVMAGESESVKRLRQKLLNEDILIRDGDLYRFTDDFVFSSPSSAAAIVLGRSANGWIEWKYPNEKTLDEVVRQGI